VEGERDAGPIELEVVDPAHPDAQHCLRAYLAEIDARFDTGFDPDRSLPAGLDELSPPAGLLVVARRGGEPVGCAGLKLHGDEPAELKRMWVAVPARGLGLARRLLADVEARAAAHGAPALRLDTNRTLAEAISLYRSAGFREIDAYNDEPYAHHWFEKDLAWRAG
jgi:GNAT superfamily N-acetyltransferase